LGFFERIETARDGDSAASHSRPTKTVVSHMRARGFSPPPGRMFLAVLAGLLALAWTTAASAQAPSRRGTFELPAEQDHRSMLRIAPGTPMPAVKRITIGVDKSMLVELPVDLTNVLVSNPEVLDAVVQTSRQVYLLAKETGDANAFFIGPDGQKVLLLEVTVARDLAVLVEMLHRLIPGARIRAEQAGDTIVLSGSVLQPIDASRAADLAARFLKKKDGVVNLIAVAAKEQVLLKVKVAEMQRDALRRIGVDLSDVLLRSGQITFETILRNAFPVTGSVVLPSTPIPEGGVNAATAGKTSVVTWANGTQNVQSVIQMLERTGLIRTLAEPNLTAISGETAKFLAGGEFPIPVSQQDNRVSVEFKQFGVSVQFKPVVLTEGRISLTVSAEVSEISTEGAVTLGGISLPGLKVRRAETTLEIPSGGTLAMAGLLSDETRQSVEGVPGLKNVPILGALFRSNDYRRRETELVILVTPFIATHAARGQPATPDAGFAPERELKELFLGHLNRVYGRPPRLPRGRMPSDYGFIIEYPDPGVKG
jgi:pilus assembly protein CpaC